MFMADALWVVAMAHSMNRERKMRRMDDLISRQAALYITPKEKTDRDYRTNNLDDAYEDGFDDALNAIAEIPSAERRGRWIPVTEELPAYGEDVLLSMNRDCSIGYLVPTYDERQYEWHHLGCFYFFNEVDAWMPLPTPYKGGEQNE